MLSRIRTILNNEDISASKLAEKLGVQRSSISHILSERNKPSLEFIQKLIESFPSINPEWVLNGKGGYLKTTTSSIPKKSPEPKQKPVKQTTPLPPVENTLFSEVKKGTKKQTIKVITFYSDGTFDEYTPNQI